jgi:two-component system, cell cycle sensor histidine kinase and response regulator CckA
MQSVRGVKGLIPAVPAWPVKALKSGASMAKTIKSKRIYGDQVQRIIGQSFRAAGASLILSIVVAIVFWETVPKQRIVIWLTIMTSLCLMRIFIHLHFRKSETTLENLAIRRNLTLALLAASGFIWGSAGVFLFPYTSMVHQVFLIFVLGGMIAGSVGIFASITSAFYLFSIPVIFPIIFNLYRLSSPIQFSMGAMLSLYWVIMLATAKTLHREIIESLNYKYENLDLISELEKEIKDRQAAEQNLLNKNQQIESIIQKRTAELIGVNQKLLIEIEERKTAEEALKNSEQKYRELADSMPQIVFETDENGKLTFVNRNTFNLTGYDETDFIAGMNALQLVVPENRDKVAENIQKMLMNNTSMSDDFTAVRKDGSTFPISVHAAPVIWNKRPVGLRGIIIDLTEKKSIEEEQKKIEVRLQRAEKMETLGIMAGGVAHDLNNILSGIVSYPDLLLMQVSYDSPLRKPLQTIQASGQKAAAIVQDLLTLTRRGVINQSIVNLNKIIEEYLQSPEKIKLMSFHPGVELDVELEKELLNTLGSPIHLAKTVMNLLSNAAEASPKGGRISLTTRNQYLDRPIKGYDDIAKGDYVVLSVSDNGIGISQKDINRVFEPFFTKKVMGRSGTGLGMSVVWGTVKDHKGYIDVESSEGSGSTFRLFFPVTRAEYDAKGLSPSLEACQGSGELILLVDDSKEQREIASGILKKIGYKVAAVASGEEATAYIKDNNVTLVLLDMIMDPGMDGLDTYRKILQIKPDQRAIIASGFSETERVREAQSLGAGAYVQKPYTLIKLATAVKLELDKKK